MQINFDTIMRHWRQIEIIYPYPRSGHTTGTLVQFSRHPSEQYPCTPRYVLRHLADFFDTDLTTAGKFAQSYEGGDARKPPLILDEDFCLIPVKMQQRNRNGQPILGYAVLQQIDDILPPPKTEPQRGPRVLKPAEKPIGVTLRFLSGNETATRQGAVSLRKGMQRGEACRKQYLKNKIRRKIEGKM